MIVCLGATAAQALLGAAFRVTQDHGRAIEATGLAPYVVATVHPASILRAPDPKTREADRIGFVEDLRAVYRLIEEA